MPTFTHVPVLRYLAVCENRGCSFREEHLHLDDAQEAIDAHRLLHELRHTCRYDEHAGWVDTDACEAHRYENARLTRRSS